MLSNATGPDAGTSQRMKNIMRLLTVMERSSGGPTRQTSITRNNGVQLQRVSGCTTRRLDATTARNTGIKTRNGNPSLEYPYTVCQAHQ